MGTLVTRRRDNRNPVARAPILRKGGVHQKTNKAKRRQQKRDLQRNIQTGGDM